MLKTTTHPGHMTFCILESQHVNCFDSQQSIDKVKKAVSSRHSMNHIYSAGHFFTPSHQILVFFTHLYYRFIWCSLLILVKSQIELCTTTLSSTSIHYSKTRFIILMYEQHGGQAQNTISKDYTTLLEQ